MRSIHPLLVGVLMLGCLTPAVDAAEPADPARFLPAQAQLFLKVEKLDALLTSITKLESFEKIYELDIVRPYVDSTQVRRFYQLIDYYERELGAPWPELVDRLAGGGMALAVRYLGNDEQVAVGVIQSKDPALLEKFFGLVSNLIEEELARSEAGVKLQRKSGDGFEGFKVGPTMVVLADGALLLSNNREALEQALKRNQRLQAGESVRSMAEAKGPKRARKLLPKNPLAWLWFNLNPVKQTEEAKQVFARPRNDFLQTLFFSGVLDVARRANFISAGIYAKKGRLITRLRMPAGTKGMPEEVALHVPLDGQPGSLPLLQPKGVIFSHSFYFDFKALWEQRTMLFPEEILEGFEKGVKQASRFTLGTSLDKMFVQSGPYHRFVIANTPETSYSHKPTTPLPAFAFVTSMRDPKLGKSIEAGLRAIGLGLSVAGIANAAERFDVKMRQETYQGVKIISYHFDEEGTPPFPDPENLRFNFTPCFAQVDDQFVLCSKLAFCKRILDELGSEDRKPSASNMHMRFYAKGVADSLNADPEQLLTQLVLDQAIPLDEARSQTAAFIDWAKQLGFVEMAFTYKPKYFQFELLWNYRK